MSNTIKFLVSGFEASGKSTLVSQIENALVINLDRKEYTFSIPHINYIKYISIDDLIDKINTALTAYKEKYGKFPKYIIWDTITQLYTSMVSANTLKYSGFDIHTANNRDTAKINNYIEDVLIANGVSNIIVAHTIPDEASSRFIIPAQGQFNKAGSWLSVVHDSIFIEKSTNKLVVHQRSFKYPARSTLSDLKDKVLMDDYDINKHLEILTSQKDKVSTFRL